MKQDRDVLYGDERVCTTILGKKCCAGIRDR